MKSIEGGLKEWNLTPQEQAELQARLRRRVGREKLIAAITDMFGYEVEAEADWWTRLHKRLRLPPEFRLRLIVNSELGKVWIKDEVPELDSADNRIIRDNPESL